ncbi:MAG: NAD/NADP octopine/nopaline dehydrogenase family protein [Mogibacterium sp.]|nr:NAD/NADP octopine/nopaline dehydrogenase family protein [Mogibacterium sp.]
MKITIAGGGNIGTQFAVHIAEKGHEVIMFTSNPGIFSGSLSIIDKEGNTIHEGKISLGFMALTLTPSNPILHTARLKTIFSDYRPGVTYDSIPLFYEDWDDASSELLMACDDEIQDICRALPGFGLEFVVSERMFYKAESTAQMTKAISSEESLKGLTTPSVKAEAAEIKGRGLGGIRTRRRFLSERIARHIERRAYWRERTEKRMAACCDEQKEETGNTFIPDLHSRYFTADFPYGLSVIQQIGNIAGVDMPKYRQSHRLV